MYMKQSHSLCFSKLSVPNDQPLLTSTLSFTLMTPLETHLFFTITEALLAQCQANSKGLLSGILGNY